MTGNGDKEGESLNRERVERGNNDSQIKKKKKSEMVQ